MARPDKAAAVEEIKQQFENSDAVLLTEYRGLTVAQMKELRVSLGENVNLRRGKEHADQDCSQGSRSHRSR
jgi:ribosomal protein L10